MGKNYDLSKSKEGIKEIKTNLENKKGELSKLEEQKQQLLDAITDVEGAKIDDSTKKVIEDSLKSSLEANKNKGGELSNELGKEMKRMEEIKQDAMESMSDASNQKSSLMKKKSMLDRFGIGKMLDGATKHLDQNMKDLEEVKDDSIETMRELEQASLKASTL